MSTDRLFKRKAQLVLTTTDNKGLDLSQLRFKFHVEQSDIESPNAATIRIYNLSPATMDEITGKGKLEYSGVILDAGYEDSVQFGTIFNGTIKQFKRGRETNVDSYLDILASDNDIGYNFHVINRTLPAQQNTPANRIKAAAEAMGVRQGYVDTGLGGTVPAPRSKVMFGLARQILQDEAVTQQSSWSVQDGALQFLPLTSYVPTEAVVLNSFSGMIGIPEQTDEGIRVVSLMNPRLVIGGLVKINNRDINQISAQRSAALPLGQLAFNSYTAITFPADVSADGVYRVFVVEHIGDTRGHEWYSDLTCLSLDPSVGAVDAYG